ncbi:GNAT family N-acetyltransferase [Halosimplex aquaticum]|uniref:GNAT family N-acetyltransferase n=1 Tax=Halosimplex aquaticum TaxID=3026162 RepID=A0ABD5Y5L6_9EURY|nr:GNAT family N-acetyltransferase [Halosimplex aquaticum]
MELVEATREDVETLAEYWYALATAMESYDELNEVAFDGAESAESGFERQLERDDATVYLLVAEETEVGYLLLREDEHPSRVHSAYADIVDLFVAPEHRGQGYGSEALDAVKQIASDRGAEYVTVSCEWHNDGARRFYEDNGFTEKQVTYAQRLD